MLRSLVGSEMCIRDRVSTQSTGKVNPGNVNPVMWFVGGQVSLRWLRSPWRGARRYSSREVRAAMQLLAGSSDGIVRRSLLPEPDQESAIFVNSEVDLARVKAYGFDYDYTLVQYNEPELNGYIYKEALRLLVEDKRYPAAMLDSLGFNPRFATRGLHFDVRHGTLIKLDCNYGIQPTAVTQGNQQLARHEARRLYQDRHLSLPEQAHLRAIQDAFAIPEACLLADTVQWFLDRKIAFKSEYLVEDVQSCISSVHISGAMYEEVAAHPDRYIMPVGDKLRELLFTLQSAGKQLFIITNSPYWFMDAGMRHLLGPEWREFFHVIVAAAGKPSFFTERRNFRLISTVDSRLKWGEIGDSFMHGRAYAHGSLRGLMKRVPWVGSEAVYCGDHLHSDLVEPARSPTVEGEGQSDRVRVSARLRTRVRVWVRARSLFRV
eukprot:TRINITY_DN11169_c0_g6_i4.p1 TRINITY_DN11169_c0_g6~~TRINITY_DN11169_c0_g6_i4.p1  ORF type:complete len:475 (-),score=111.85 TRINITY_DN11169_c0_g6_i4:636-1937(-)